MARGWGSAHLGSAVSARSQPFVLSSNVPLNLFYYFCLITMNHNTPRSLISSIPSEAQLPLFGNPSPAESTGQSSAHPDPRLAQFLADVGCYSDPLDPRRQLLEGAEASPLSSFRRTLVASHRLLGVDKSHDFIADVFAPAEIVRAYQLALAGEAGQAPALQMSPPGSPHSARLNLSIARTHCPTSAALDAGERARRSALLQPAHQDLAALATSLGLAGLYVLRLRRHEASFTNHKPYTRPLKLRDAVLRDAVRFTLQEVMHGPLKRLARQERALAQILAAAWELRPPSPRHASLVARLITARRLAWQGLPVQCWQSLTDTPSTDAPHGGQA